MTNQLYSPNFEEFITRKKYGPKQTARIREQAALLNSQGLPLIINFEHFSEVLDLPLSSLGVIVNSPSSFYRRFEIPKKSGGQRIIEAPYPFLLDIQHWILVHILKKIPISFCAHGFVPDKSIVSHVRNHATNDFILKVDIKNFFPSIKIDMVYNFFRRIGYSKEVSYIFSALCCKDEVLPQGAATSPSLSNILFTEIDHALLDFSINHKLIYSRYADDLVFSGYAINTKYIDVIQEILNSMRFKLNDLKTVIYKKNSRKIITGIEISNGELKLPRKKKRLIRQELYYLQKYGLLNHLSQIGELDPIYLERLLGKLSFWRFIEPDSEKVSMAINQVNSIRHGNI